MAFQSIKKLLPPSCACMNDVLLKRLVEGMLCPGHSSSDSYLRFCRKIASQLFPLGWDSSYRKHVESTGPVLSATLDATRSAGGGTSIEMDQDEFFRKAYGAEEFQLVHECEALVVQSAGKPRPLTKYKAESILLKPLHKSMYDRLSGFGWLLRGDLTPDALDNAGFRKGKGGLVSGDYRSATDNLPLDAAEAILDVALENACYVPESVRDSAKQLLRPLLVAVERSHQGFVLNREFLGVVSSGQQMGSLLSFPLLCAQNYIAFRWAMRSYRPDGFQRFLPLDIPVLINGDDILFQTPDPRFFDAWVGTVKGVGLEVEMSKTSFSDDFGSLNSTLVRWRGGYLRVVPTVRMGMLRSSDFANSLSVSFRSFTKGLGSLAYNCGWQFLSWHRQHILRTGRTARELGFTGSLAWRLFNKMKLQRVPLRDQQNLGDLPPAPTFHNFALTRNLVEMVEERHVGGEDMRSSIREMTSWKWSLCRKYIRSGTILSYLAALSRPGLYWPGVCTVEPKAGFGAYLTKTSVLDKEREAYFAVRPAKEREVPFFLSVDRLPSYGEVTGDYLESGPTTCEYGLHRLRLAGCKWALKEHEGAER